MRNSGTQCAGIVFIVQVKLNRNKAIFHFGFCIHTPVHVGNALAIKHHYIHRYVMYIVYSCIFKH